MDLETRLIPEKYNNYIAFAVDHRLAMHRNITVAKVLKKVYGKYTPECREYIKEAKRQWGFYRDYMNRLHYKYDALLDNYVAQYIIANKTPLQRELADIRVPK